MLTDSVEKLLQHKLEVGLASMMCLFSLKEARGVCLKTEL